MRLWLHPVADEATDQYLVYDATARSVLLTEPLRVFLEIAATDGLRPILVTSVDSHLSPITMIALAQAGGFWAVHNSDGVFDGITRQRIDAFPDLWRRLYRDSSRELQVTSAPSTSVLGFDIYAQERADPETRVGRLAVAAIEALGGASPELWGPAEPLLADLSFDEITTFARSHMPIAPPAWIAAPERSFAQIRVGRARHGLVEQATGGVIIPVTDDPHVHVPLASEALRSVAEQFAITVAMVWATPRAAGGTSEPGQRAAGDPLAVLIGPRAVRDIRVRFDELAEKHDVTVLGRSRTPSLLVRFSQPDKELWAQLLDFAMSLGLSGIAHAAGWSTDAS